MTAYTLHKNVHTKYSVIISTLQHFHCWNTWWNLLSSKENSYITSIRTSVVQDSSNIQVCALQTVQWL